MDNKAKLVNGPHSTRDHCTTLTLTSSSNPNLRPFTTLSRGPKTCNHTVRDWYVMGSPWSTACLGHTQDRRCHASGMPASVPMGTISIGLYFSVQNGFQLNKPHTTAPSVMWWAETRGFDLQHKPEYFLCQSNDSFAVLEFLSPGVKQLPGSWHSKISSGILREPRMTVLTRCRSNLPDLTKLSTYHYLHLRITMNRDLPINLPVCLHGVVTVNVKHF